MLLKKTFISLVPQTAKCHVVVKGEKKSYSAGRAHTVVVPDDFYFFALLE